MENINAKSVAILIIGCVVGMILIASMLAPVVDGYKTEKLEIKNEGMHFSAAGGDHIMTITAEAITLDGESVDMSLFPGNFNAYTLVYGEESFIRWGAANIIIVSDADGLHSFTISTNTITINISDNVAVVSTSASQTTYSIDDVLFIISPSGGDYVLSLTPYVNDESMVYAAGDTYYTGAGRPSPIRVWNIWSGVDGVVDIISCGTTTAGYSNMTVSNTTVDFENMESNLYRYNSVVFDYTVTYTDDQEVSTDYTLTATYTYFLAPSVVEYDNPEYIGGNYGALLGVIVVLSIVAILIMAVGFIRGRD